MIDSAMTPEPTVATVRFERGDMRASIGLDTGPWRRLSRVIGLRGRAAGEMPGGRNARREKCPAGGDGSARRVASDRPEDPGFKDEGRPPGGKAIGRLISSARRGEGGEGGAETDSRLVA